jgi:hypothetical protein
MSSLVQPFRLGGLARVGGEVEVRWIELAHPHQTLPVVEVRREMTIGVLDENRRPLVRVALRFEVQDLVSS